MALLADYITAAAAPPLSTDPGWARIATRPVQGLKGIDAVTGPAAAALRQGALALYGACSPAEASRFVLLRVGCSA